MPSLLESAMGLLGDGDAMEKLAGLTGGDKDQAEATSSAIVPAIIGGLADKSQETGGSDALGSMLDGADLSLVGGVGPFLDEPDVGSGRQQLDGIFGSSLVDLASGLASKVGVPEGLVRKMLPMLAPIVVSVVAARRADDDLDGEGLAGMLTDEKAELEKAGLFAPINDLLASSAAKAVGVAAAGTGAAAVAKTRSAGPATIDSTAKVAGTEPDRGAGLGWLWWALGAIAMVLLLAWLLSTCNESETKTSTGADGGDSSSAVQAIDPDDADAGFDEESRDEDEEVPADPPEEQEPTDADLAGAVESVVDGTGVLGAVDGDVVTLTGTVADDQTRTAVVTAVEGLDGVGEVVDEIDVTDNSDSNGGDADEDEGEDVEAGDTINDLLSLEPVTFQVLSATITAEGQAVLDQAAEFMEANPDLNFEIGGHTDDDGDEDKNLALSQRRADAVKIYLEGQGIDGARMTTKGYGEADPKVSNDSDEGKAENRRIEFTIQ